MNKIKTFLTMGATVAMLALPVAAQTAAAPAASSAAPQGDCTQEAKDANYKIFRETLKTDQPKANDAAKKYLACPAATPTEGETKIVEYLTRWTKLYEEGSRKNRLTQLLYVDKNYEEAFKLGREILAAEPEYVKGIVDLGSNGYLVAPLKNDQLNTEAVQYARQALQMLDSGKTLTDWGPLQSKDVATAYLNYTIGALTVEKDPANALKNLLKSAQFETPLKKSAFTYAFIAGAYETGPYAKQSEAYKIYLDKEETPESKLALANIHQLVDRMIDGYARAVALATDPKLAAQKTAWNERLVQWYKFRNKTETEAGLPELVASILAKPLPPEPTPLTSLPAAPAATPAGTSGGATPTNGTGNGNGSSTGNGNGAAAPATKTTTTPATANSKPANDKPGTPNKPR